MCTRYPIINRVSELKVHIELTRFVQPEKIEIDANERAVNEKSPYCFFVCTTFDSFLNELYHHLSLSFFEKIRLPDIPNDIPRHIPIPIPAMLFNEFIKTTLQSTAAIIPTVIPIIILLHFMSLSSSARLVNTFYFHI